MISLTGTLRRWVTALAVTSQLPFLPAAVAQAVVPPECDAITGNPVACENLKPGNPKGDWYIASGYGDIVGFATRFSSAPGEQLGFKVKTPSSNYEISIFRLGWYGGDGARRMATLRPSVPLPQTQPECLNDPTTGLIDCGNWALSASWTIPSDAVSGLYIANLVALDATAAAQVPFVVRNDTRKSDMVVQTSDQTWQAYNTWGGNSLYSGTTSAPDGRAFKVSYNRPFANRNPTNTFYNAEYALIRWLERNGYDTTYIGGSDPARDGARLLNHKVFVSSGHDEYWDAAQRTNVEAARAAGVNLLFLTGNEVFWKTRWEPSIDGASTPYRTLVSYKETKAGAKIDPSPEWTGTWRDPRFSPPSDGGRPANALTGTEFTVNGYRQDALEVPAVYGRNRFWRNTSVATLAPGTKATFAAGTLGYEWDEDLNNGHRPPGAINLSSTTVDVDDGQLLIDYGNKYVAGRATHKMVLYRDQQSRALVFGSGTVQWSWGLDPEHSYPGAPADARMQQATVNILADMGVQPLTLQSDLVAATASTDVAGPATTVTSPAPNTEIPAMSTVTVSGTAVDAEAVVARVEVSVDGGVTWNEASGRETWSYTWVPDALGPATVRVRSVDDSANIGAQVSVPVTIGPRNCPCTVFQATAVPTLVDSGDTNAIEVGMRFRPDVNGYVKSIRFYKSAANTGTHRGSIWTAAGTQLGTGTFTNETASGWQQLDLDQPVPVMKNTTYVVSYHAPAGRYSVDKNYFATKGAGLSPLTAPQSSSTAGNGLFRYGAGGFPNSSGNGANYWVDVVFEPAPPDTTAPTVTARFPEPGAQRVPTTTKVTATFDEDVDPATVTMSLTAADGTAVAAQQAYDGPTRTASLALSTALKPDVTYTASVRAADLSGNVMPEQTWSFTASCPCGLWSNSTTPAVVSSSDTKAIELGLKFRSDRDGYVTGVRFYKGALNTGTHTGTMWTSAGELLATGTFTNETASGWQTMSFASPVAITRNTTYVVSYHAPVGRYSADRNYFLDSSRVVTPLTALQSGLEGGNGVYRYGASGFPKDSFSATNYWVDPVFDVVTTDTTAPTVTATAPAAGATEVPTDSTVKATFSEQVTSPSLRFTVTANGTSVPGTVAYSAATSTATFTPSSRLATSTRYDVSVTAADPSANPMAAPQTWSFTTAAVQAPPTCPCSIWSSSATPAVTSTTDTRSIEVGVRWRSEVDGYVTGIRFYKGPKNTGVHTGSLWTNTGTQLATGTFTGETAGGWQTLTFATPVRVTAGQTYVASYLAPSGGYSITSQYFTSDVSRYPLTALASGTAGNGLFSYGTGGFPTSTYNATNYWVDVVFTTA